MTSVGLSTSVFVSMCFPLIEEALVTGTRPRYSLFGPIWAAYGPRKGYNSPKSVDSQKTLTSKPERRGRRAFHGRRGVYAEVHTAGPRVARIPQETSEGTSARAPNER